MIQPIWRGETAICIATGPSLRGTDVDLCRNRGRTIAINDAYRLAPWSDAFYGCDAAWWNLHEGLKDIRAAKFSLGRTRFSDVTSLKFRKHDGLDLNSGYLATGRNSGHQAINLAVHFGVRRILLLGFDCRFSDRRKIHFNGNHPSPLRNPDQGLMAIWLKAFATLKKPLADLGIEIINCSRDTALDCFPRQSLSEALSAWQPRSAHSIKSSILENSSSAI